MKKLLLIIVFGFAVLCAAQAPAGLEEKIFALLGKAQVQLTLQGEEIALLQKKNSELQAELDKRLKCAAPAK